VLSRCLSAIKDERTEASKKLEFKSRTAKFEGDRAQFLDDLEQALYASKIISYAQGFMLMQEVRNSGHPHVDCKQQRANGTRLGCHGIQLEAQQAFHRPDVAWRLHHP